MKVFTQIKEADLKFTGTILSENDNVKTVNVTPEIFASLIQLAKNQREILSGTTTILKTNTRFDGLVIIKNSHDNVITLTIDNLYI